MYYNRRTTEGIFETSKDAYRTLTDLTTVCSNYGQATVADLFRICRQGTPTISDWGSSWTARDLQKAQVIPYDEGYKLILPEPSVSDKYCSPWGCWWMPNDPTLINGKLPLEMFNKLYSITRETSQRCALSSSTVMNPVRLMVEEGAREHYRVQFKPSNGMWDSSAVFRGTKEEFDTWISDRVILSSRNSGSSFRKFGPNKEEKPVVAPWSRR